MRLPWWLVATVALFFGAVAHADGWVELRPGRVGHYLNVVDAFLVSEYGDGYTADPLSRTHAYLGLKGDQAFVLVRHDSVCGETGCPILVYRIEKDRNGYDDYVLIDETFGYYRVFGRDAVIRYDGEPQWLWSDPHVTDQWALSNFPLDAELARCCGYVYGGLNLSLEDVYVGWADVDRDGSDEVLIYVHDGWECDPWYPSCIFVVLDRSAGPYTPWRTLETQNGIWYVSLHMWDLELMPCPADRHCRAVYIDDAKEGERRTVYLPEFALWWSDGVVEGRYLPGIFLSE